MFSQVGGGRTRRPVSRQGVKRDGAGPKSARCWSESACASRGVKPPTAGLAGRRVRRPVFGRMLCECNCSICELVFLNVLSMFSHVRGGRKRRPVSRAGAVRGRGSWVMGRGPRGRRAPWGQASDGAGRGVKPPPARTGITGTPAPQGRSTCRPRPPALRARSTRGTWSFLFFLTD